MDGSFSYDSLRPLKPLRKQRSDKGKPRRKRKVGVSRYGTQPIALAVSWSMKQRLSEIAQTLWTRVPGVDNMTGCRVARGILRAWLDLLPLRTAVDEMEDITRGKLSGFGYRRKSDDEFERLSRLQPLKTPVSIILPVMVLTAFQQLCDERRVSKSSIFRRVLRIYNHDGAGGDGSGFEADFRHYLIQERMYAAMTVNGRNVDMDQDWVDGHVPMVKDFGGYMDPDAGRGTVVPTLEEKKAALRRKHEIEMRELEGDGERGSWGRG